MRVQDFLVGRVPRIAQRREVEQIPVDQAGHSKAHGLTVRRDLSSGCQRVLREASPKRQLGLPVPPEDAAVIGQQRLAQPTLIEHDATQVMAVIDA